MDFEEGEVLLINKPRTWTSFDVVNKVRYALRRLTGNKKIKVGHAGTLDPLATGLLLICTGKMTKRIDEFTGMDKVYTGTFFMGATTPSYDLEKEVDAYFPTGHLTSDLLAQTTYKFKGELQQFPPIYSAIKVDGVASYVNAREGIDVAPLKSRTVFIHDFDLTSIALPEVNFLVKCSKGTYIRSLANDFGKAAESGAYLQALCRTQIGDFNLAQAWELDKLLLELNKA
jgi:tRNA pseudouridine55 synthase